MITKKQIQMSETFLNSAVLAVSGGFQDAYRYKMAKKIHWRQLVLLIEI